MNKFDITTPDIDSYIPDSNLIGKKYRHTGNDHIYRIISIVFLADLDRWSVTYIRDGCPVVFVRTIRNFFGARQGKHRFEEVQEKDHEEETK